jgi:hypothetical protein
MEQLGKKKPSKYGNQINYDRGEISTRGGRVVYTRVGEISRREARGGGTKGERKGGRYGG